MSQFARIAVVVLLVSVARAQQTAPPSSPSQQPPRFRGGTNLVRVDAVATKNGAPVQDLKADDFELFEDGTPQKIENFEHIVIEPTPPGGRVDPSSLD